MYTKYTFFNKPEHVKLINRKSVDLLKRYMTRFGNIKPRRYTGTTVKQQKMLRKAIIRARELGLLPYTR